MPKLTRTQSREVRQKRVRAKVIGTAEKPRLAVFRSNTTLYVQAINDDKGETIANANGKNAVEVGKKIGEALKAKKIDTVVFDRGGYQYIGKIKALADSAREAGLKF